MLDDPTQPLPAASASVADQRNSHVGGNYFSTRGAQFSPLRMGNTAEAYINGRTAMQAMAQAIRAAEKFILIADWQMNFDVELDSRGNPDHPDRLSELLFHAMERGVDVRILLYDSIEAAAYTHENENLETLYQVQERLSPSAMGSVEVALQNPASGREDGTNLFFSHHQKMLLIDGRVAFLGGLDFAHGRWDDGNFDVVCDPRIHVINDHYNNCLPKGRQPTDDEWRMTRTGLGRGLNDRPGFAEPYLPGLVVALDRFKEMWANGETLAELASYADKTAVEGPALRAMVKVLADIPIDGYRDVARIIETVGDVFESIGRWAREADHKYREATSAASRAWDEAMAGNVEEAGTYALRAFSSLVPNPVTEFQKSMAALRENVDAVLRHVRENGPAVVDAVTGYARDPESLLEDVKGLLDRIEQAFNRLWTWINTPIERTQLLSNPRWQPRMPWQDVHMQLRGPAVFDVFRNFVYRWNATVVQNRGMASLHGPMLSAVNLATGAVNRVLSPESAIPQQTKMGRADGLTSMDAQWLASMGGREALFGDVTQPGSSGNMAVQILRSSGKALHKLENKGMADAALSLGDQPKAPGSEQDDRNELQSILDAMLQCIGSAKAYIYIETQFFISDCGYSNADGETLLANIVKNGRSGEMTGNEKIYDKAAGTAIAVAAPIADRALPGSPLTDLIRNRAGEPSPAKNRIVEALAERIGAAIDAGDRFHVYITLPVHPEGSIFDGPVVKQQYWIQQTLMRGENSLIRRICRKLVMKAKPHLSSERSVQEEEIAELVNDGAWRAYLTVLNLRSFGVLQDEQQRRFVVTEQCYVHSKLMIVDDAVAIIGSANINDRSLLGNGDTELAAVVVDGATEPRDLGNGHRVVTRGFARDLRMKLWRKFLGMEIAVWDAGLKRTGFTNQADMEGASGQPREEFTPPFSLNAPLPGRVDLDEPVSEATVNSIRELSDRNANIYEEVFRHVPRDSMWEYTAATDGFKVQGYELDEAGNRKRGSDGRTIQKVARFAEPPALQPAYMRKQPVVDATTGATTDLGEHDVKAAFAKLKELRGFWVRMPLDWGYGMSDPAGAIPAVIIANNSGASDDGMRGTALASTGHRPGDAGGSRT
ncbi:phospholipase D-like domain-containing protein [Luteimonas sp. FCS-9]|uniref:phospholipase D-like domain-containing protein n=1 Tax=Luteimonas sp. FCS-9 TaxID=1547516 RepID=UPI00069A911B|nr:phospholipase D-like domain-containing protein [Luteimonas sp. FCS-9]